MNKLIMLGAASLAREFYWHAINSNYFFEDFIFVEDLPSSPDKITIGKKSYRVINDWNFKGLESKFIVAVGNPSIKETLVRKAINSGLEPHPTIVNNYAVVQDPDCDLGFGGMIAPGCILTTNIKLENYVTINLDCTVGHDTTIGEFSTLNPGCHVSGYVNIDRSTTLGTGSIVRDYVKIGKENMIGAQSAVVKNILENSETFVGVPAKKLIK